MESNQKNVFDLNGFQLILEYFEKNYIIYENLKTLEEKFKASFAATEMSLSHKIVLGVILLESFHLPFNVIGTKLLDDNLKSITPDEASEFMSSLDEAGADLRYYILTYLIINYHRIKFNENFLKYIYSITDGFLLFSQQPNLNYYLLSCLNIKERKSIPNPLLDELLKLKSDASINYDYVSMIEKYNEVLCPYYIAEAWIFVSQLERHPQVHAFRFIMAVRNIKISCICHLLDALFCSKDQLNYDTLAIIVNSYYKAFDARFPIREIWKFKHHVDFFILFVELSFNVPDMMSFTKIKHTPVDLRVVYPIGQLELPENLSSLQYIDALLYLYNFYPEKILKLLKSSMTQYPDVIFLGMLQLHKLHMDNPAVRKFLHELITYYVKVEKSSIDVLKFAWKHPKHASVIRPIILQVLQEYYGQNFTDISIRLNRVLEVSHSLKALGSLLRMQSLAFVVEIALLAAKKNYINLYAWLVVKHSECNVFLIQALFNHLQKYYPLLLSSDMTKVVLEEKRVKENSSAFDQLIPFLYQHRSSIPDIEIQKMIEEGFANYRFLIENKAPRTNGLERDRIEQTAELMTQLFQECFRLKGYQEKLHFIDKFIEKLSSQSTQNSSHSYIFYLCECATNVRYYQSLHDIDLHTVACLISRLSDFDLINSQKIIDLIDQLLTGYPIYSRNYYMANIVLCLSYNALICSPTYCGKLIASSVFNYLPPFVRFCAEYVYFRGVIPTTEDGRIAFIDNLHDEAKKSDYIRKNLARQRIDTLTSLGKSEIIHFSRNRRPPPKSIDPCSMDPVSERIYSLIDEITEDNVTDVASSLVNLQTDDYILIAKFIVYEKVPNFLLLHRAYRAFIRRMDSLELFSIIRRETNDYITILLSMITKDSHTDKLETLYIMGLWFGLITIADNFPLSYTEVNIKHLLVEANLKGQDNVERVLPFVKNFLAYIKESIIFGSASPWLIGIWSVLIEIQARPEIRPFLKFEIESLIRSTGGCVKLVPSSVYMAVPECLDTNLHYLNWNQRELSIKMFKVRTSNQVRIKYNKLDVSSIKLITSRLVRHHCPEEFNHCFCDAVKESCGEMIKLCVSHFGNSIASIVESVIKEDFRTDYSDVRMRYGSHVMAKSVTLYYVSTYVKQIAFPYFLKILKKTVEEAFISKLETLQLVLEREKMEEIMYDTCQDNIDLMCAFIIKACTECVIPVVDNRLFPEIEYRKSFIGNKNNFTPKPSLMGHNQTTKKIKQKNIYPTPKQMNVYHEFNKHLSGFANDNKQVLEQHVIYPDKPDRIILFDMNKKNRESIFAVLRISCKRIHYTVYKHTDRAILEPVNRLLAQITYMIQTAELEHLPSVVKLILECHFKFYTNHSETLDKRLRPIWEAIFETLLMLHDLKSSKFVITAIVTRLVIEFPVRLRNNVAALNALISKNLICLRSVDNRLSRDYQGCENIQSLVDFVLKFVKCILTDRNNRGLATEFELLRSLDFLSKVSRMKSSVADKRNDAANDGNNAPEVAINEVLYSEQKLFKNSTFSIEFILKEWIRIYYTSIKVNLDTSFKTYFIFLVKYDILSSEETLLFFVKSCFDIILELIIEASEKLHIIRSYQICDSFVHFIMFLIKYTGGNHTPLSHSKLNIYNKVLNFIYSLTSCSLRYHTKTFKPSIYERIIFSFITEMSRPDPCIDQLRNKLSICLLGLLYSLNLEKYPVLAHSVLNLLSHPHLMSACLKNNTMGKSAGVYMMILNQFLRLLNHLYSLNPTDIQSSLSELTDSVHRLFSGLYISYPDFLSYYYIAFMNELPSNFYQLRNIILSSVPSGAPISFDSYLSAPIVYMPLSRYIPDSLIKCTDNYLVNRSPDNYKDIIVAYFQNSYRFEPGTHGYKMLNAYIYHIGDCANREIASRNTALTLDFVRSLIHFDVLYYLVQNVHYFTRFQLLTSLSNNIRFPSSHSKFYIFTILNMYILIKDDYIREQITRILFERVLYQPYPSGIIYALKILFKNPEYAIKKFSCLASTDVDTLQEIIQTSLSTPRSK